MDDAGKKALALCVWLLLGAGCLYDAEHRCGDDRVLQGFVCVCKPGQVERSGRCQPAPQDAGATGPGAECQHDADCTRGARPICRQTGVAGYCTEAGCASDGDCPEDFFCVTDAAPSFCARPPTGQGMVCSSAADCQGFDASFCGVGDPRGARCCVPDCTEHGCAPGYTCYDLSQLLPGAPRACVQ